MPKKKPEECPPKGSPAYMTTYGDMMTLLLTFFVLLLSFSSMQEAKFRRAIGSLKGALGVLPHEQSVIIPQYIPIPSLTNLQESEVQESIVELEQASSELDISEAVRLEFEEEGIHITLSDSVVFDTGQARLKPGIVRVLNAIAELAQGWDNTILIEGHTDNVPIRTPQYPSNWYLSSARAIAILNHFRDKGLDERDMIAIGRAEFSPIDTNETAVGRARNRRVEIFIQYEGSQGGPTPQEQRAIDRIRRLF
ncbi:flagellar motor protein MotB [candidate division KSB1 bacterium]